MITRREINPKHENAVIDAAIAAHNKRIGANFSVDSRPDPPDAILIDEHTKTWIEHTDAFYPEWAEDLTSFAASDKEHKPMRKGLHVGMDSIFADEFVQVVLSKINKISYKPFIESMGKGILVVGLESPWLSDETIQAINDKWKEIGSPDTTVTFSCIYLGFRSNGKNEAKLWSCT